MRIRNVLRMHSANAGGWLGVPLIILAAAWAVVMLFVAAARIASDGSTEVADAMYNGMVWNGAVWSILGPLMGTGFTIVNQYFPLALGFGITRKEFWAGTTLHVLFASACFAAIITVLKVVERATNGWFIKARMFDNAYTGTGDWWQTLVQTFLILVMAMFLGAVLATVHSRWGQLGVWLAVGAVVILLGAVGFTAFSIESFRDSLLTGIVELPWGGWMAIIGAIGLAGAGTWFGLVRGAQAR